jgi:hypothetical protein
MRQLMKAIDDPIEVHSPNKTTTKDEDDDNVSADLLAHSDAQSDTSTSLITAQVKHVEQTITHVSRDEIKQDDGVPLPDKARLLQMQIELMKAQTERLREERKLKTLEWRMMNNGIAHEERQSKRQAVDPGNTQSDDDLFVPTGLCSDPDCHQLQGIVRTLKCHSDVDVKRSQRADIQDKIAQLLRVQDQVNVYIFDDFLPLHDGADTVTLLAADLLDFFGTDRIHIWAPNVKEEIVNISHCLIWDLQWDMWAAQHRRLVQNGGVITAGKGCWHNFNARWAEQIREAGGLDVVFADCFRGFDKGVGALVRDLVDRRLLREKTVEGSSSMLSFAVSDRPERAQGRAMIDATVDMFVAVQNIFSHPTDPSFPYTGRVIQHVSYGRTMHYVVLAIEGRH